MRFEIERKFLVANENWRAAATGRRLLRDGLIGQFGRGKVRIRLEEAQAWITVKGAREGIARPEFEYEIPLSDGEAMLRNVCVGCVIEKTRYCVPVDGMIWEVDVFGGVLTGVVIAEIELTDAAQAFTRPEWIGQEVTGDVRFRQSTLLHLCNRAGGAVTMTDILALPVDFGTGPVVAA